MSLKNKVVLITGGSSGIGASAAVAFSAEGAIVNIVGRNEDRLKTVAFKCRNPVTIIQADLSIEQDIKKVITEVITKHKKLDVLINNAGIFKGSAIESDDHISVYDETMTTNVRSVVVLTHLAVPFLKESKGNIINVSSIAGSYTLNNMGMTNYSAYCISKAALNHYTSVCASELAVYGIRVNAISPGPVETPILGPGEQLLKQLMGHELTQPSEVADLMVFLAGDKAKSINGSNYVIDSGATVRCFMK